MRRDQFLRKSLGMIIVAPVASGLIAACTKDPQGGTDFTSTGSTNGNSAGNCTITKTETEGPFPTHNPGSNVLKDIRSDRGGVLLNAIITIKNKNSNCTALEGAFVDIWHCDADGLYSEYGGTGMQSTNLSSVHFLRGRQTTDASGAVGFTTIFPGWYSGRAVHIHVHIFDKNGKSLLVTQIAFPATICDTVFTTATNIYKKGKADTTNERDNVFSDGYADELATMTGNINDGFMLTHTIVVSA
jgi:protocatechuate 3,4-dioxygenase beta subunit